MKNYIFISFIAIFLFNCTKTVTNTKILKDNSTEIVIPKFAVDSVQVEDSVSLTKNLQINFSATSLFFPTIENSDLLDSIYFQPFYNFTIYDKDEIRKDLENDKEDFFEKTKNSLKEYSPDSQQTWNQSTSMEIFSKQNNILTIQYSGDGYSGGAHGYYNEVYKNFNLKSNDTYQLKDIFTTLDSKVWEPILLKNYSKDNEVELLFEKEIPLNNNFYFDENMITFVYNQYEIGPYAAGVIYIKIPFSEIAQYLKPQFKVEMNIN